MGLCRRAYQVQYNLAFFSALLAIVHRCMEHAIHLGASHFINSVSPTSTPALSKKIKWPFQQAQLHGETVDLGALDAGLSGFDEEGADKSDEDVEADDDERSEFGVGDTIGKALALVKKIES